MASQLRGMKREAHTNKNKKPWKGTGHKVPLTMDTSVTVPRLHNIPSIESVCWSHWLNIPFLCNRIYDDPR